MNQSVHVRPEAESELREAWSWYESQREGLGDEFLMCVEAAIASAARSPEMNAPIHHNVRRMWTRRFPYGVFYVFEPQGITVLAVFHASRDPQVWRDRD